MNYYPESLLFNCLINHSKIIPLKASDQGPFFIYHLPFNQMIYFLE